MEKKKLTKKGRALNKHNCFELTPFFDDNDLIKQNIKFTQYLIKYNTLL